MPIRSTLVRLLVAVAVTALSVLATAPAALAHAELVSSAPAGSATVRTLPEAVTLRFSETVRTPAFVEVTGPDGEKVAAGEASVRDARVTQRLGATAGAGRYAVSYRITSADGHPISGTLRFTVQGDAAGGAAASPDRAAPTEAAPPAEETAPAASADGSGGGMGTAQLVLLLAVLAVGLVALAAGTRRALRHSVALVDDPKSTRTRHG